MNSVTQMQKSKEKIKWLFSVLYILVAFAVLASPNSAAGFMQMGFCLILLGFVHNEAATLARDKVFVESLVTEQLDELSRSSLELKSVEFLNAGPIANFYRMLPVVIGFLLWFFSTPLSSGLGWLYSRIG